MEVRKARKTDKEQIVGMILSFRETLKTYRDHGGLSTKADALKEYEDYLSKGYDIYVAMTDTCAIGYMVLKIVKPCVWVESLFVKKTYRGNGAADVLFDKAETVAGSYGEETVYNNVHPNNASMIRFLQKRGYDVLNLIEIRKATSEEKPTEKIDVGSYTFNY